MKKEILVCDRCEDNKATWKMELVDDIGNFRHIVEDICDKCATNLINKVPIVQKQIKSNEQTTKTVKTKRVPEPKPEGAANFKAVLNPEAFTLEADEKRDQKKILAQMDRAAARCKKEAKGKPDQAELIERKYGKEEDIAEDCSHEETFTIDRNRKISQCKFCLKSLINGKEIE